MNERTIEILVSPQGEVVVQTRGYGGPECRQASRFLEEALGQTLQETLTPEFHQGQATSQPLKHQA